MSYSKDIHKKLADGFWENYSTAQLKVSFEKRIKTFFLAHQALLSEEGVSDEYIKTVNAKKNLTKTLLVESAAIVFLTKKIFNAFKATQDEEIQLIMDEIIWVDQLHQNIIKEKLDIQIWETTEKKYNPHYTVIYNNLLKPFLFFKDKKIGSYSYDGRNATYALSLPLFLRQHLVHFYPKQKGADLIPLDEPKPTAHIYDKGSRDIFLELQRIIAYESQGNIKVSQKNKPQASTLSKMQRKLNLQEFYTDADHHKNLKIMRTTLLAGLVVWFSKSKQDTDLKQILKILITKKYKTQYNTLHALMYHLKGNGSVDPYYTTSVGDIFLGLLKKFPHDKWISIENIESHLKYNFIDIKHIEPYTARDRLYYEIAEDGKSYKEKLYINSALYQKAVAQPLLRGTFFLFAAFGLLDIAYDTPDVSVLSKTAYSYYDGLKYVKLNDLGAFIIGKTNTYSIPEEVSNTKIKLSEDSLTIVSDKNDPTAAIILEPYTQKVTANRFRTDFSIFLKGVTNKTELQSKISSFRQFIPDLPENWETFFKELDRKIDPLSKVSQVSIFKIPADDPVLINLIAKDEVFQKIVMKAEGYHILVTRKNLAKFKERMRGYGYLLSK